MDLSDSGWVNDLRISAATRSVIWNLNTLEMAAARGALPSEPEEGGVLVKLRFPASADNVPVVERRFQKDACIKDVFNLAVAEGITPGYVELYAPGRRLRKFENQEDGNEKLGDLTETDVLEVNMEWSAWYLERKLYH